MVTQIIKSIPLKIKICLTTLVTLMFVFNFYRLIFLYFFNSDFNLSNWHIYVQSFYYGFKMDTILSVFLFFPIFILFFIPNIDFKGKIKASFYYYVFLLLIIIGFLNVINIEFFKEFGSHLNMQAQMYGFESGFEAWIQVWVAYPILTYFFIIFIGTYLPFKILKRIINSFQYNNIFRIHKYFYYISFLIFVFINLNSAIFKTSTVLDDVYFTNKDDMANNLAINSIYHYIYSLYQNQLEPKIHFYENADQITENIIAQNRLINDKIKFPEYDTKPNIILIVLESHIASRCNFLNSDLKQLITPNLDYLASKSINFKNCYANGPRTAHGLSSILCSWPTIPGYPLIRQLKYQQIGNTTFSSIFKGMGYETGFIYGGNSEFDEMKNFVQANSFDKIYDHKEDDYLSQFQLDNKYGGNNPWGVFDEFLFNKCLDIMNKRNNSKPIMLTLLTTTNHAPWVVPEYFQSQINDLDFEHNLPFSDSQKTMKYVDFALGKFFNQAKQYSDWFKNTIFIITADHGLNIYKDKINHPKNGHIPFLIYNSRLIDYLENDKLVSHIDILPTILDLIGHYDEYDQNLFGCSGFRGKDGFVFRNNDYNIQFITDDFVYSEILNINFNDYYPLNNDKVIRETHLDSLKKICRAYSQSAFKKNE